RPGRPARRPVLGGLLVGLAAWGIAQGVLGSVRDNAPSLDTLAISTLDAKPVAPGRFAGKPVILNLWASWCPPCRREMPVLARAQADHPELTVLMLNQGEDASTVRGFLSQMGLRFDEVMLDPRRDAMRVYGSRGLPTTLFFDARGRLVESHVGEITAARLEDILQRQFGR
ncbi:TlpA family protein disulfide reductase, partial [Burkholderia sp. Cy-647]|uniref:TlpA family protein disulfide reductase n=1 Tax=Burkholderia sp. Cy-647 TaxID=2608328 RepID=UPI0014225495